MSINGLYSFFLLAVDILTLALYYIYTCAHVLLIGSSIVRILQKNEAHHSTIIMSLKSSYISITEQTTKLYNHQILKITVHFSTFFFLKHLYSKSLRFEIRNVNKFVLITINIKK